MGLKKKPAAAEPRKKLKAKGKPVLEPLGSRAAKPETSPSPPRGGTELATKISASVSLIAAIVLAVVVNIYSARHYTRWDLTKGGEFTLSAATIETLKALGEPVHLIVLTPKSSPIGTSLAETLESYSMHTDKLDVQYIDPDSDRMELAEVQKKYGLLAGEAEGRMVTDALMIVIQGDRHRFVRQEDLERVEDAADTRVRPSIEYAVTSAIRLVRISEQKTICFTTGHGEPPLDAGGAEGMAELRERLTKNNYEVTTVFEPRADSPKNPLADCDLLVLAGPRSTVPPEHVAAMKSFIENGGNALLSTWSVPNERQTGWVDLGVADLFALAGVAAEQDLVFEMDPAQRPPRGNGEAFFAKPGPHPVTEQLLREQETGVSAVVLAVRSLRDLNTDVKPEPLLVTSPKAFGAMNLWDRNELAGQLKPGPDDHMGPLVIATASQRPDRNGKKGARIVILQGTSSLLGVNWTANDLRGNALLVEGAFSWLASHERFLDIPDKPLKATGVRLTEDALISIRNYVLAVIPASVALLGIAVFIMRRRRPQRAAPASGADA
jgi:hypothetical protein